MIWGQNQNIVTVLILGEKKCHQVFAMA
jgi:hypothetical protein